MLTNEIIKQINDFVYSKPRTILEISELLHLNWRTADRYVEKIAQEQGTIGVRTFRGGTRGALKVVFWNNLERIHSHVAQESLFQRIVQGKHKTDFSPLDIYQYVEEQKRQAFVEHAEGEEELLKHDFVSLLRAAQEQLLFFSGNLSWTRAKQSKTPMLQLLEELAKNKISIKILTRIELPGIENIQNVEAINHRLGREAIEIRHGMQPLRGLVIDKKLARFKEIKNPKDFKEGELAKQLFIFYTIHDEEWVDWCSKVFWHFFRMGIPYQKRVGDLRTIQKLL